MNRLGQYQAYQTETATPEDRVALLYDGARRFTDRALTALEAKNFADVGLYTGKAQRILIELSGALDYSAGEIAHNLEALYEYWNWRLGQGLLKQDPTAFREVSATLMEMHGAWAEAAKQVRAQRGVAAVGM